jgi:two-component system phosphate regulon sensor histidine kinase PhoR
MRDDNKTLYNDVAKTFSLAFNRLSFYSIEHPLSREILAQLFQLFDLLLKENLEVLVARGPHAGEIFINQEALDSRALGLNDIYEKFKNLQLDAVSLTQGLTYEEVANFVRALVTPLAGEGDLPMLLPDFFQKGSEHIKIRKGHYEKIENTSLEKDKDVVPPGTFADFKVPLGEVKSRIDEDAARVREELWRDLSAASEAILEKAKASGDIKGAAHELIDLLSQEVVGRVSMATEELSKSNKALGDEKRMFEEIFRHLTEGLVVMDGMGRVIMMNPAAEDLLDDESRGSLSQFLLENIRKEHFEPSSQEAVGIQEKRRLTNEIELPTKEGIAKKVLRVNSAMVRHDHGKVVGMVSVISDITEEKELGEMKSRFVSLVTHELRTPVVAIQKSLELILSKVTGQINADQERFLMISKHNLTRLSSLINDLLDMSKLEAGKFTLNPSTFDFRSVVNEVKTSLLSWADEKEISFRLDLPNKPLLLIADRDRLIQVLVNLVGNALKFTPKKGEVGISARFLEGKEGVCVAKCLEVKVVDSGIGIDPNDFKRIFNKFEQATLVSPLGAGGTGLGLAIAKEIINLHGGDIWVESEQGKGSRFIFVIPKDFKKPSKGAEDVLFKK